MKAHQKAAEDMRKISNGEQVTGMDLLNIRACLMYGSTCLDGLDPAHFSAHKVTRMIDHALETTVVTVSLPAESAAA